MNNDVTRCRGPMTMTDKAYYIGVDVGTGSARAVLLAHSGGICASAYHDLRIHEPRANFYQQSTDDIWLACCSAIKQVTEDIDKKLICGIGFDATSSVAVFDTNDRPLSVSPDDTQDDDDDDICWNVIMWLDHRAADQSRRINETGHSLLKTEGGRMDEELDVPKLMWLKENKKDACWDKAGHFFSLPDFLSWRATGNATRSMCSLVCRTCYNGEADSFAPNESFFKQIGIGDLLSDGCRRIGMSAQCSGQPCGSGLSHQAATETGLLQGTPVGMSLIDAYAGYIGSLACSRQLPNELADIPLTSTLVLVCGTSTCHMISCDAEKLVTGVRGPNFSAIFPGYWTLEGGQNVAGKLVDFIINTHPAYESLKAEADKRDISLYSLLHEILNAMAQKAAVAHIAELTHDLHVWPDFHGNRSPLSHLNLTGMICGLTLSVTIEDLAKTYLATIQALACGTLHIIEVMREAGYDIRLVHACGGLANNSLYVQTHADIIGLPIVVPDKAGEIVSQGAALLGASASGKFSNLWEAMQNLGGNAKIVEPDKQLDKYYAKKYKVFQAMVEHQQQYQNIMRDC